MTLVERRPETAPKILIVEDEPHVCELISDVLGPGGFDIECAGSDAAAYDALGVSANYACLILDVNLGAGTTGYDIGRFARRVSPGLPVIFVSGQSSADSARRHGVVGSHFLAKPFTSADLMKCVRQAIGDNDA